MKNRKLLCVVLSLMLVTSYLPFFSFVQAQEIDTDTLESSEELSSHETETSDKESTENEASIETNQSEQSFPENPLKEIDKTLLKGYVSKIPSGTKLTIIFETPIDEITSMVDDEITARIGKDIVIEDDVVVPAGSTVNGKISEINYARKFRKSGSVKVAFENLTLPDGRQVPIVASVLSRSGLIKGRLTKKAALISGATIVGPAAAGFGAGLAAEGSPVGGLIGVAVGALAGITLFAFQKGNMVDVKAGDEINIELVEEAYVPSKEDLTNVEFYKKDLEELQKDNSSLDLNVKEFDFTGNEEENLDKSENKENNGVENEVQE